MKEIFLKSSGPRIAWDRDYNSHCFDSYEDSVKSGFIPHNWSLGFEKKSWDHLLLDHKELIDKLYTAWLKWRCIYIFFQEKGISDFKAYCVDNYFNLLTNMEEVLNTVEYWNPFMCKRCLKKEGQREMVLAKSC